MKQYCIYYFLCIATALFISCSEDDSISPQTPPPIPEQELIPLKVGNFWTYQVKRFRINGQAVDSGSVTLYITKDSTINGTKWFIMNDDSWLTNRLDGYWIRDVSNPNSAREFRLYKFPITQNEVYQIADNVNGKAVSLNDTVTVPNGVHVCYRYQISERPPYGNKTISLEYIKPEVGIIREVAYAPEGFVEFIAELISYRLE